MKPTWPIRAAITSAGILLGVACDPPPAAGPSLSAGETFRAEDVTITGHRGEQERWVAHAATAQGTDDRARGQSVTLRRRVPGDGGEMVVRARRGDFGLESGEASLTEVVITWDDHGRLEAPSASYQEHSATLHLHAPVSVHGPALTLKAGAAQVDAERGSVTLSGPVRGRWEPDHRP